MTKKMKFFTGLAFLQVIALFNFLGDNVYKLTYWSSNATAETTREKDPDQENISHGWTVFVTLVRLRRGMSIPTLSYVYNLSQTTVRNIFTTWLQLLYCHYSDMKHAMFPERQALKKFLLKSLKAFKNVRCSVDCTECLCADAEGLPQTMGICIQITSITTHLNVWLTVAPSGAAVFVSNLFKGAVIRQGYIWAKWNLTASESRWHDIGSRRIYSERGFTVREDLQWERIYSERGFTVNGCRLEHSTIFVRQGTIYTPGGVANKAILQKGRIHVERYNERVKKFLLLWGTMPLSLSLP